ncbi:MAG: viologen exporter family transport system permease protein [Actinomycetota bacterium]|jgi:ABC-2 type transport system permease protein|nr:viologen exporter family transport system permease protein [Actinomycetota bacterium]
MLVSLGFYAIVASVIATLWRTAAHAHGGSIAGYSGRQLTWYLMTSEAATVALNVRLIEQIGDDIASGTVAVELLRPASVLGVRVATELGRCLPRLAGCAAVGVVLAAVTVGAPPRAATLLFAVPSLVLAVACNLVAQHAFAGAAFWVRDARSTWFLYQKFVFVLGGMLLPLQVLPAWLHTTASWLPFMAMAYAPARLASGHLEPQLLVVQVVWLVVLWALATVVFAAGERRLQVVGG